MTIETVNLLGNAPENIIYSRGSNRTVAVEILKINYKN
jgi:hypothetical protein